MNLSSSNDNPCSTVILASPASYNSTLKGWSFTTQFTPTNNVAGQLCYLVPKSIMYQTNLTGNSQLHLDPHCVYYVYIDIPMPYNSASIHKATDGAGSIAITGQTSDSFSQVVAALHIGGHDGTRTLVPVPVEQPRTVVRVPDSPRQVTVRLLKANAAPIYVKDLDILSFIFELHPIGTTRGCG